MNRASLAHLLAHHDSPRWRRSHYQEDVATEDRWLPVLDLLGHGFPIGLTKAGTWVIESVDGLVPLDSEQALDSLLDCLYRPRLEVVHQLQSSVEAVGLPVTASESFPILELVAHAVDFSPFYAELALEWIKESSEGDEFLGACNASWKPTRSDTRRRSDNAWRIYGVRFAEARPSVRQPAHRNCDKIHSGRYAECNRFIPWRHAMPATEPRRTPG